MKSVFQFRDYKEYLLSELGASGIGRGSRTRLAEALGCQSTFISQVLNGATHFSLEHAMLVSEFLRHSTEESHYFICLVHHGRAGSEKLRHYYDSQIKELLKRRKEIQERIKVYDTLSLEDQVRYYSSWHYAAIHVMATIPAFQTKQALASALEIPLPHLSEYLDFLTATGILKRQKDRYVPGPARIHLPKSSPMISKLHANWRMQAMRSADVPQSDALHFTSVYSLSSADVEKIREILLNAVETTEPIVRASPEEVAYCVNIDFFQIHRK